MKIITKQIGDLSKAAQMLKEEIENKNTFRHVVNTYTEYIYFEEQKVKYMFSDKFKSFKELGLMQSVKREIQQNISKRKMKFVYPSKISYFKYDETVRPNIANGEIKSFKNVIEIDLTAAYFYGANKLKLISSETLEKILLLPKKKRLSILGSIASKKVIYKYIDGILQDGDDDIEIIKDEALRNVWFTICKEIDKIIIQCYSMCQNGFLFYYVDGIYFIDNKNKTYSKKILALMSAAGYPSKLLYLDSFEVSKINDRFLIEIKKQNSTVTKIFRVAKQQVKYVRKDEY